MKILIEAGSKTPLPTKLYGGTQRVVWDLAKELSERGHKIVLLAPKGSAATFAERVIVRDPKLPPEAQIPADVDICHFQNFVVERLNTQKPYVITMHGNVAPGRAMDKNTIFVSRNHAERYGARAFVYNGMDWSRYAQCSFNKPRTFFHFLGKGSFPVKNLRGAIEFIKRTKTERLAVLGARRIALGKNFRVTFSRQIDFHGMVGDAEKSELLARSRGLIFPVLWHEPFGLAITESLFMGCPVFGTPFGSLPELVKNEVGFLSENAAEIIEHLGDFQTSAARKICHDYAADFFNARIMADGYLKYYEIVLNGGNCNESAPKTDSDTKGIIMSNRAFFRRGA